MQHLFGVTKLLYLGSSCIYPRMARQPMSEDELLGGSLEPTNEPYAVAKIAGIMLCQPYRKQYGCDFISAMPTNLYGPNDNFDLSSSHVLPAMIRKFHDAKEDGRKEVTVWGTGSPRREFLHEASVIYGRAKPDGSPRKLLNVSRLHTLGWRHRIQLREGIKSTYDWFLTNHAVARGASVSWMAC